MDKERYHISREEIAEMDGVNKTHFLNPNAIRNNKSLGDLTGITGFGFHLIEIEPGRETTEYHRHFHEDECVFVLEGTATAITGDEETPIGPGDFIGYRRGGLAHTIRNTGEDTLRCIVVGERLPHDVGEYPSKGKRIYRNAGLPWSLVDRGKVEELGGTVGRK